MGIPGFFSWLRRKYPAIVKDVEVRSVNFDQDLDLEEEAGRSTGIEGFEFGTTTTTTTEDDDWVNAPGSGEHADGLNRSAGEFTCRNLYLDTNGIIHAGTHPAGKPAPETEAEMFQTMHAVLDRIVSLAQPVDLIFIAVDGVAPRAKINQQRARRFVAARSREAARTVALDALHQLQRDNFAPAVELDAATAAHVTRAEWDHNAISPGTEFMDRMMAALKKFVAQRMKEGGASSSSSSSSGSSGGSGGSGGSGVVEKGGLLRGWASPTLRVVFSDCSVPGEGEHKIMDFIRREKARARSSAAADSEARSSAGVGQASGGGGGGGGSAVQNEGQSSVSEECCTHCIYGEDADLIMLALALHDPGVRVMRQLQEYHRNELVIPESIESTPYAVVDIQLLRRHLDADLFRPFKENIDAVNAETTAAASAAAAAAAAAEVSSASAVSTFAQAAPLQFDLERAIDDFVLIGFFIGNDFLPALPALDIRLGALELLLEIHTETFAESGWLTDGAQLNFSGLGNFLSRLASVEAALLQQNHRHRTKALKAARYRRGRKPLPKSLATGAKPCTKFAAGRNCRKGDRCAFLHGDVVPLFEYEKRKRNEVEQMLRRYLADDSPSGEVELDVSDAVGSKKSIQGLFNLCDRLGLDYSKEDVAATGDIYVSKYEPGNAEDAARRQRRFLASLREISAHDFELRQNAEAKRLRESSERCDDVVDVHTPGFRQRFYEQKLRPAPSTTTSCGSDSTTTATTSAHDEGVKKSALQKRVAGLCQAYVEGMQWVLSYYHSGCVAWDWYYPDHYAPFALELAAYIMSPNFEPPRFHLGAPLRPFEQLVAILPASSARHLLPPPYAAAVDSLEWRDIFPVDGGKDFEIDPNSQEKEYMWLPLLPFLDTRRVREVANAHEIETALTEPDKRRNTFGTATVLAKGDAAAVWKAANCPGAVVGVHEVQEDSQGGPRLTAGSLDMSQEPASVGGVDIAIHAAKKLARQQQQQQHVVDHELDERDDADAEAFQDGSDANDDSLFAADFADAARQQKFAPLGTLDAAMQKYLQQKPFCLTNPAAEGEGDGGGSTPSAGGSTGMGRQEAGMLEVPFLPQQPPNAPRQGS